MSHASVLQVPRSLNDIDATFLPVEQMRQITRVTVLDGAAIEGEVDLGLYHWVWSQHSNDPIFPGTLMIEAAGQLIALWPGMKGRGGARDWCEPAPHSTIRRTVGARIFG